MQSATQHSVDNPAMKALTGHSDARLSALLDPNWIVANLLAVAAWGLRSAPQRRERGELPTAHGQQQRVAFALCLGQLLVGQVLLGEVLC